MSLRVLIVDDEPLARTRLRRLLQRRQDSEIVGECADGVSAVALIREHAPDVVLLDIRMPEMDGFEVLDALRDDESPSIVFVTAYEEHAVRAFEVHAFDYLLKPVDAARLDEALDRVKAARAIGSEGELAKRLAALLQSFRPSGKYCERTFVKTGGNIYFVKTADIDWIQAAGNYLELHVGPKVHVIRETIGSFASKLDPQHFSRIHRSRIVNLDRVHSISSREGGDAFVTLLDGTRIPMSRSHRGLLDEGSGR